MFEIILNGKVVACVTAWDLNDALVYASRRFGPKATARRAA